MLRYSEFVFTKESQGTEFFVVVALLCKFWSTSKLCMYVFLQNTPSDKTKNLYIHNLEVDQNLQRKIQCLDFP